MSELTFEYDGQTVIAGTTHWNESVLSADPFEGDFGDGNNLQDKIVKARKAKRLCSDCLSICQPGTFNRGISTAVDGELVGNRYCQACCTAMAFDELHHDYIQYDEDSDNYPDNPVMLSEVRQAVRNKNEKFLIKKLGKRYFDQKSSVLYAAMEGKDHD